MHDAWCCIRGREPVPFGGALELRSGAEEGEGASWASEPTSATIITASMEGSSCMGSVV
jgi:hypothetical protein